ncbi:nephrin-like [Macrobrachium rosenbergii]|uniref:nephrin-like n=1 Tax=Macrobrachium rosenbergii TaxID=79674 RepID=UPI0034D63654
MMMALLRTLCVLGWITLASAVTEDSEEVTQLTILVNETVTLPCSISTQSVDDVAVIILWYKGASPAPFYSYDLRQPESGRHWSDETVLGQRAFFDPTLNPPSLKVTPVRSLDQDTYRCRVDYERGPSKTSTVLLVVIVPPSHPVITDESGNLVKDTAGPYLEGGRVVLTCKTIGGRPSPTLVWLRNGVIVGDSYTVDHRGQVRNLLHLDNLSRKLLDTSYTCRASNSNITQALDATVAINLTLAPLTIALVKLTPPEEYVSAGTIEELECSSSGSRPDAAISWWRDNRRITNPKAEEKRMLNRTVSILRIVPKPEDHGVVFTCRVENPILPSSTLEESYKLNVHYVPKVELLMGLGLSPNSVKEGTDIFFECRVVANPKHYKITWVHEGTIIEHNVTGGVIMSNMSLVLQRVGRNMAGRYYCRATNLHGEGVSNPIPVTVMYAPVCSPGQKTEYQVAHHDTANITCKVNAVPDNVTFTWRFNSSGSLLELAEGRAASWGTTSVLPYTPASPGDYGLLLCAATNAQGAQHNPCVYNITASKPPDLLEDCIIKNQTTDTLFVSCKGIPTVLPRTFSMEVRNSEDLHLVTKVTNTTPHFIATGLDPGTAYTLHVGVHSPMGASTPVKLQAFTVKTAEKRMGMIQPSEEIMGVFPLVAVVVGAAVTIVITLITIVALAIKHCPRERSNHEAPPRGHQYAPGSSLVSDGSPKETVSTFSRPSPASEDRNPDIIPQKEECDYQLEELRVPSSCQVNACHGATAIQVPLTGAPPQYVSSVVGGGGGAIINTYPHQKWDAYYQQQHILQYHPHHHQPQFHHQHHHQHHLQHPSVTTTTSSSQGVVRPTHESCQIATGLGGEGAHHQQALHQQTPPPQVVLMPDAHAAYLPPSSAATITSASMAMYGGIPYGGPPAPTPQGGFVNKRGGGIGLEASSSSASSSPIINLRGGAGGGPPTASPAGGGTSSAAAHGQEDYNGDKRRHESSV